MKENVLFFRGTYYLGIESKMSLIYFKVTELKKIELRAAWAWLAQLEVCATLDLGVEFKPHSGCRD